jgi:hypothetical protein
MEVFMKRLVHTFIILTLGALFIGPTAFAGVDYRKYQEDFMNQKQAQPKEEKLQHISKPQREQKKEVKEKSKEGGAHPWTNKYERSYWAPQE